MEEWPAKILLWELTMDRAAVISLAKNLLDEKGSLYWTDSLLNTLADEANKDVYRLLVQASPDHLLETDSFVWPANAERIDLEDSAYVNKEIYKLLGLESTSSSGGVTKDNLPTKWMPMRFVERAKFLRSGGVSGASNWSSEAYKYAYQAEYLYIAPIPGAALNVLAYFIPTLSPLAADGTQVLSGRAAMFHDAVYKRLAVLMNIKQNGNNQVVDKLWQEAVLFIESAAESRYSDEPQSVRVLGHY